ncbi:MAG: PEGA domain-containing protein [Phycisphaeraceae bacterium]|nr:PEGA domain-containing protein [Phycisphaeraceae bacterium]MCW5763710.1 PEGA domain-containing protein [Phycisphaeraceae bacterium]
MKGIALLLIPIVLTGCIQRRIVVTSDPPGAIVWLNDTEIGRTPAETAFTYYGRYDVRLELPGYQSLHTSRRTRAPFHEYPGPDLVATVIPHRFSTVIEWHFELEPFPESVVDAAEFERGVIDRARALRAQTEEGK